MDIVIACDDTESRWALADALGTEPERAHAVEEAFARAAHPATVEPDVVLLVAERHHDLQALTRHVVASPRSWIPVVAITTDRALANGARTGGAAATVLLDGDDGADRVRAALAEATAPAVVIDLASVRETA